MTGLLQPLDVCVNRSFQAHYEQQYVNYLQQFFTNESDSSKSTTATKLGQIRVPDYAKVAEWVTSWKDSFHVQDDKNPFNVCELVHANDYTASDLHRPLRELVEKNCSVLEWESAFTDEIEEMRDLFLGDDSTYSPP